jgi:hypothetical protein
MQVPVPGQAFDGFEAGPFGFYGQDEATVDRNPVHKHRTGAAVAVIAAFLRTGQPQGVA